MQGLTPLHMDGAELVTLKYGEGLLFPSHVRLFLNYAPPKGGGTIALLALALVDIV